MTRKPTTPADDTPIRFVIVTLDSHLAGATERAVGVLKRDYPGLRLSLHAANEWADDPDALARCKADIAAGDVIVASMLFLEEHIEAVRPALEARRESCDAMLGLMSAGEIIRLTKLGPFTMDGADKGPLAMLKRLRGAKSKAGASSGAGQMKMLRRLPKILRFIPGAAQDLRAYFLAMQYWIAGSEPNVVNMVRMLIDRYASGPRAALRGQVQVQAPKEYPETGLYHPDVKGAVTDSLDALPIRANAAGTVGLLVLRSYILAGDTAHYDGVIRALEARGLQVVPAFASGLDARDAVEAFFLQDGLATVDAVVSLTGFSLVGGPAYNDSKAAEDMLARLDRPYLAAHPLELQTLQKWGGSERGLLPIESTIMVAIPELDGATNPIIFGGRSDASGESCDGCERHCTFPANDSARRMHSCPARAEALAARAAKLVALRTTPVEDRKVGIVLFNFPPNSGAVGTAAYLSVYESLHRMLIGLKADGYRVDVPPSVDALRDRILQGNADRFGADANVAARIATDDHVRREPHLEEIEAQWGPAPGRQQSDGRSILVFGETFGNVFVGVQPAFGYEGDPMRLLFEKGFAPTHAFSAFYRYLREDFGAHAVLHFGTHGALEFMPGKQVGLSDKCWPDRLIGDLPNVYLYAANNPSEGAIAKRRIGATLVSYLTPPVAHAGLYRGLVDLKASVERWRAAPPENAGERADLAALIEDQARALDLVDADAAWTDVDAMIADLQDALRELEATLIPEGLHVAGSAPTDAERVELLTAVAEAGHGAHPPVASVEALIAGASLAAALAAGGMARNDDNRALMTALQAVDAKLAVNEEIEAVLRALDGRYIRPAPAGDLLRAPEILPTGRNLHGFDPFRIPSTFAVKDGAAQAEKILTRHMADGADFPQSIAIVLWGTDNLKTEGGPIGQVLALIGARPRVDSYGKIVGATLIPLEELGRPRVDVVVTLSGIFRDLLPLQTRMLAEAAYLAATAEEPEERNFVRKHALAFQAQHGCDMETAALRVFSNADGAYGANVNLLIDSGAWSDEDELADAYSKRKCFAYGRDGAPTPQAALLDGVLAHVDLAYQNLDSVDLGVTTIDHYVDTLGGISRAVKRVKGEEAPVYIGDQTQGDGKVRTLSEQVALESRTRTLNPRWYEGMLKHGYEGVRQIEAQVTNTLGWSATTGQVSGWVYQQITQTYVLDDAMRARLADLNPKASMRLANRLLEAHERNYWQPDDATLDALRRAGEELEDRLEGVTPEVATA